MMSSTIVRRSLLNSDRIIGRRNQRLVLTAMKVKISHFKNAENVIKVVHGSVPKCVFPEFGPYFNKPVQTIDP